MGPSLRAILASSVLLAAGCASHDDTMERLEFEKLRTHPVESQEDRIFPAFESAPGVEEALLRIGDPFHRIQEIRGSEIEEADGSLDPRV